MACAGLDPQFRFAPSLGCFVVRLDGRHVLCDAGIGPGPNAYLDGLSGRLPLLLEQSGLSPSDIDAVVFTHLHMDHIGWAGIFANARLYAPSADMAYFLDGAPGTGRHHVAAFDAGIRPLLDAGRIDTLEDGAVIRPGLRYLPTPGHTPGHQSLLATGGGDTLCITGDVFHCPGQVERPDWSHRADLDPDTARRSRRRLLERAVEEDWRLAAGHFRENLQIGRIGRDTQGYVWQPHEPHRRPHEPHRAEPKEHLQQRQRGAST